ncbi:MAG: lytic transglycosylase domain-containing protein [Bacteroidales bacterium]|nr:lytic transglycosylase domain-containing protein [Bacteroidales bacterium]
MVNSKRKTLLTASALISVILIILLITGEFKGYSSPAYIAAPGDTVFTNKTYKLPEIVTFAGEKMPLENFDTRESLEREILTSAYRHSSTILIIKRANRYLPVIEKILRKNNIPDDFKFLAAAESEYSNMVSPVGATGFWQIMPETGREQGMEINSDVDERYDVEKSTQFACDYFRKSFERYGNWTLAAASYNGGRAAIDEQIEIQDQHNYYDLLLSEETARYIFRAVAYKLIITDPASYGFTIGKEDLYPELRFYEVRIDTAVTNFSKFAERFSTNYKLLKFFNPWLRKPYLNPKPSKVYFIKIPAEGMRRIERTEAVN